MVNPSVTTNSYAAISKYTGDWQALPKLHTQQRHTAVRSTEIQICRELCVSRLPHGFEWKAYSHELETLIIIIDRAPLQKTTEQSENKRTSVAIHDPMCAFDPPNAVYPTTDSTQRGNNGVSRNNKMKNSCKKPRRISEKNDVVVGFISRCSQAFRASQNAAVRRFCVSLVSRITSGDVDGSVGRNCPGAYGNSKPRPEGHRHITIDQLSSLLPIPKSRKAHVSKDSPYVCSGHNGEEDEPFPLS